MNEKHMQSVRSFYIRCTITDPSSTYWRFIKLTGFMVGITGCLDFVHRPVFWRTQKYTTIRKLDLFPSTGEGVGAPTLLGPLQKTNCNSWTTALWLVLALSNGSNRVGVSHPLT
jgi:hypothetical protein